MWAWPVCTAERVKLESKVAIRSVCFDIGGVIARISMHWYEILERLDLPIRAGIHPHDDLTAMPDFDKYQAGVMTDDEYYVALASYLGGFSIDDAKRVHAAIIIEAFPGVLDIVQDLNSRGLITGCLSNTNAPHWQEMYTPGRLPAFTALQVHVASFNISASKPHPAAFRAYEVAANCAPSEILYFDDYAHNVVGAEQVGWTAHRIDPLANPAAQMREKLRIFL